MTHYATEWRAASACLSADPELFFPIVEGSAADGQTSTLPRVASVSEPELQTLTAEYYDTDDLRLLRAGITLRRREGGSDAGWHLKLPDAADGTAEKTAGASRRQEI